MHVNGTVISDFWKDGKMIPLNEVRSKQLIGKQFPDEKWNEVPAGKSSSVFISSTRQKDGEKDPDVFASDKMMSLVLAEKTKKSVFMIPERGPNKKPDCVYDGDTIELKHVRGGQRKVGKNALLALPQSENVFLYVDKPFSIEGCLSSVKGCYDNNKKLAEKEGKKFIEPNKSARLYIFTQGQLYKYKWGDLI